MKMKSLALMIFGIAFILIEITAHALVFEGSGNKPVSKKDYNQWEGIMPLVNDTSRVYSRWVNGNEWFYYRGNTSTLNKFLEKFSDVQVSKRMIILTDEKPEKLASSKSPSINYDWKMHLMGGTVGAVEAKRRGVKPKELPVAITIYRGSKNINPRCLCIPKDMEITHRFHIPSGMEITYENKHPSDGKATQGHIGGSTKVTRH
jgi:hypothetical protein